MTKQQYSSVNDDIVLDISTNNYFDFEKVFVNTLLYYNTVEQVISKYAKLNKYFRKITFLHLSKRIVDMNSDTKRYEDAFDDIVTSIQVKRLKYYNEYEIEPPSKEKALGLLH